MKKLTQEEIENLVSCYKDTSAKLTNGGWVIYTEDEVINISPTGEATYGQNKMAQQTEREMDYEDRAGYYRDVKTGRDDIL